MKSRKSLAASASALALAGLFLMATGASAHPIYLPTRPGVAPPDPNRPSVHIGSFKPYVAPKGQSGTWTDVADVPFTGEGAWGPLLLTDGSVIMKHAFTGSAGEWYKLTPDSKGSYTDGTWTAIASMPSGYQPDFYASQVLPNGNVLIEGGEYNQGSAVWTDMGAIYDPVANTWTAVSPPSGWSNVGDAESTILPNGTYMLANCCSFGTGEYALGAVSGTTVTWSPYDSFTCGSGQPCMDEDGFTDLPDGDVILVDVWNHGANYDDYYIYDTAKNKWKLAGHTPDYLSTTSTYELGATPLTPERGKKGTIVQLTANQSPGVNDVYDVASGTWTSGPVLKVGSTVYFCADAPAATLPDGHILVEASPGYGATPAHFWEIRINKKGHVKTTQVNDTNTSPSSSDFTGNLLPLPTGQVLWDDSQYSTEVAVYTPAGKGPRPNWLPVVSSVSASLTVGSTGNAISGTNFNGFDQGGYYGDDAQQATNYPLVRITNNSTGDVCWTRSYNFSTMGVWTSGTTNAEFDIPGTCATGASTLQVIVNGIASAGTSVTLSG